MAFVLALAFVVMQVLGIELHQITLGASIVALGLLVYDASIAVEMMMVKIEQDQDRIRGAASARDSASLPMLIGMLVTVAGFLPEGFVNSADGEIAEEPSQAR